MIQDCWIAFLVGGLLCAIGQVLIDYTKLTPARILTGYVVAGVLLSAVGLYPKLIDWAGGGASVPLTGFGNLLAQGVRDCKLLLADCQLHWGLDCWQPFAFIRKINNRLICYNPSQIFLPYTGNKGEFL